MEKIDINKIDALISLAVDEDYGSGDPTSEITIAQDVVTTTILCSREDMIVCGMDIAREVLARYDSRLKLEVLIDDGTKACAGEKLATITGPLREMLSAERVLLNFLQRLSGVATMTNRYAKEVVGTKAKIYDTRKTTPGWRLLEKYAVRCGGGENHRINLSDGVMLKDNHFAALGADHIKELTRFVEMSHAKPRVKFVCVEVDEIDQFKTVLKVAGVDIILLDNMTLDEYRECVKLRDENAIGDCLLEASGGITIANLRSIAETGVDRISIGAITHSAVAVDIGLDK